MSEFSFDLARRICGFLDEDGWHYTFSEQDGVITMGINMNGKIKSLKYVIMICEDCYTVYAISPMGADINDSEQLAQLQEFICRANYGLKNGNFEIDVRDGEIRYKSFVDCEDVLPSNAVIKNSIYCPPMMFDRYEKGILGVLFGGASADQAIKMVENSED